MKAIFAVNSIGGFGDGNTMPWPHNPTDLARFKRITSGCTVVMGRGTWDSDMPKPLPKRRNIVLSKTLNDTRCEVYSSINDLLLNTEVNEEVFVIGGAKILWQLRPYIKTVYLTKFHSSNPAPITVDVDKYLIDFNVIHTEVLDDHTFTIYERI